MQSDAPSWAPSISPDGTAVGFSSGAATDHFVLTAAQNQFMHELHESGNGNWTSCADYITNWDRWQAQGHAAPAHCPVGLWPYDTGVPQTFEAKLGASALRLLRVDPASVTRSYEVEGPSYYDNQAGNVLRISPMLSTYGDGASYTDSSRALSDAGNDLVFTSLADNLQGWGGPTGYPTCSRATKAANLDTCEYGGGWYYTDGIPYVMPMDRNQTYDIYLYHGDRPINTDG